MFKDRERGASRCVKGKTVGIVAGEIVRLAPASTRGNVCGRASVVEAA